MYETINKEAEKRGMSVRQLEKAAGLGNGTISGWKESSPNLDTLERVADALGMNVTTLISRAKKAEKEA